MDLTLCHSLLKWLKTFPGHGDLLAQKLTDGVAIAKILNQIAPEFFSEQWLVKIKTDVGDNWRLKVSNLRKIYESVLDYYREHLDQPVRQFPAPDLKKIGEMNDEGELGRLLQLILGCAINCQQKQRYIEAIMGMEENVQTVIVKAIQELMNQDQPPEFPSSHSPPSDIRFKAVYDQLDAANTAKGAALSRCMELDHQLSLITEERNALKGEKDHLMERIEILESGADEGVSSAKFKELRTQVNALQDELYKVETSRDEYRVRVEGLEKENMEINERITELQTLAEEARALKDEVDSLRDMKEKISVYEGQLDSYKKKLEELPDLRRQVKTLQDKNSEYMQHNMELEEELKRSGTWRRQSELCRQQISDLHQKLSEETKKVDRKAFENKKLNEKLEADVEEKKRMQERFDSLKEKYDELKCSVNSSDLTSRPPSNFSEIDALETVEIIPPEFREMLERLRIENKILKDKSKDESDPALQSVLTDLKERHEKLLQENRGLNQQIIQLEHNLSEARSPHAGGPLHKVDPSAARITELELRLSQQNDKISSLEENLSKKETDMVAMEERYKRYLNKAKSVIRTLDPKHNPSLVPDVSVLRSQLLEKEKLIENMERESEKAKKIRETEEKLITTAFYNIGMQRHRQMVSQRLANLDQSHSFLSRQRQASGRRNMSNVSNSEFQY